MAGTDSASAAPAPPNRWCPACRTPLATARQTCTVCLTTLVDELGSTVTCRYCERDWPARMRSCPTCLAELRPSRGSAGVGPDGDADPDATSTCRHCGRVSPARMQSCPGCLAELAPDPDRAMDASATLLASGRRIPRPADRRAFADGPSCSVLRAAPRASLIIAGAHGLLEATIDSDANRAAPPLRCHDLDGSLLFRLVTYAAADRALVALGGDGTPLATFIGGTVLDLAFDVRDETSAPVGRVRPNGGPSAGWDLVETGGGHLASLSSDDVERDGLVDDQWTLHTHGDAPPMKVLGAVAMTLAAKVLLGRREPVPSASERLRALGDATDADGEMGVRGWTIRWALG